MSNKCEILDDFISHARKDQQAKLRSKFVAMNPDKGQFVFFEGDKADALYIIEEGVVEANVIHGDGKVFIFHFLFSGEFFGEGSLYGQEYFPFSTVIRKDALIWKVSKNDLMPILDASPALQKYIVELLGRKLDSSYVKARCIAGERVEKRVACILLKTLDQPGIFANCLERLDTPLTNRDISGLIGSTEETVSRIMSRLKKEGVIGIKDKQLVILDRDALTSYFDSM